MIMTPKEVLEKWIDRFNAADAVRLTELYAEDAVNHQVANKPVVGKTAIREMFANEFSTAKMVRFLYKGIIINHNKNRANLH